MSLVDVEPCCCECMGDGLVDADMKLVRFWSVVVLGIIVGLSWKLQCIDIVMTQQNSLSLNSQKNVMSNNIFHSVVSESCD